MMIFEADYKNLKKSVTLIQNILTGTEKNKKELMEVELHVKDEEVYFSYKGKENVQLDYKIPISEANSILEGSMKINLNDLISAMKSFDKSSSNLLIERDGMELRIDDGILEPEIIVLSDETDTLENFDLKPPNNFIQLPKSWFSQRLDLACINNRTSFLPSTSDIAFILTPNSFIIRSYNLTNLYEGTFSIQHGLEIHTFLMKKNAISRVLRLMKTYKNKTVKISFNEDELYLFSDEFIFHFTGETSKRSKNIFKTLPIVGMSKGIKLGNCNDKELKYGASLKKGEEKPIGITVQLKEDIVDFQKVFESELNNSTKYYPFKEFQKIVSKWNFTSDIFIGKEENYCPLILQNQTSYSKDTFILMPLDISSL